MRRFLPILLLVFIVGCSALSPSAAVVGKRRIPESLVEDEIARVRDEPNFIELIKRQGDAVRGEARRNTLTNLIRVEFIREQAEQRGIVVDDSLVETYLGDLQRQLGGEENFAELLKQSNLTPARARELARRNLYARELRKLVTKDITVDDARAREFYETNKASFAEIKLSKATGKTEAEARAAEFTDLGWVAVNGLDGSIGALVESAQSGTTVGPIKGRAGFEVFKVEDRRTKSLQEAREEILDQLVGQERERAFNAWVDERLRKTRVAVNPKYGSWDAKSESVVQPGGGPQGGASRAQTPVE